jgi:hypothetical protein
VRRRQCRSIVQPITHHQGQALTVRQRLKPLHLMLRQQSARQWAIPIAFANPDTEAM